MGIIVHILVTAALLFALGKLVDGIRVRDAKAAIIGAIALGVANFFVRPVLVLLTLPATILTLGLFLIVVNALMLALAAWMVDGFEVKGAKAALWGSIVLALMNFVVARLFT